MPAHTFFSVVVPVYNQGAKALESVSKIGRYFSKTGKTFEIIVVDDGSGREDAEILSLLSKRGNVLLLRNERNMGKGYSVKRGMLSARGKYRFFTDADLSMPIEQASEFMKFAGRGYDIVIASRHMPGSEVVRGHIGVRDIASHFFRIFTWLIVPNGFKDTQCGFKLFTEKAAKGIFPKQTINGFSFDVELLAIAKKYGFRVKETGVRCVDYGSSKVSISRHPLEMLYDLLRIRRNILLGRY